MSKKMTLWAFIPPYYITFANERKTAPAPPKFYLRRQRKQSDDFVARVSLARQTEGKAIQKKPGVNPKEAWGLSQRSLGSISKKPGVYPKEAWGLSQRSMEVYPDIPDINSTRSCPLPPKNLSPTTTEAVDRLQQ